VVYNFGIPSKGSYRKRNIDIRLSQVAAAGSDPERRRDFVIHNGAITSYLEGSIFEQLLPHWHGTSLSTIQVFLDANEQGIPIVRVDSANVGETLPEVSASGAVKDDIQAAVDAGFEAYIPQSIPAKSVGVTGTGYLILDPRTGSGAYHIEGGSNGADAEAPCPESELEPLADAIRDILLTLVLAAVLAAIIAGIGGGAAVAGGAAISRIGALAVRFKSVVQTVSSSLGLSVLAAPATAGETCQPIPLDFHKGGPQGLRSGLCADLVIGNEHPGSDICVNNVPFDAITSLTLWEVKVIDFSNTPDFVIDSQITKENGDLDQLNRQKSAISMCPQYQYGWAVADLRHLLRQETAFGWEQLVDIHRHVPECFSLPTNND